MAEYETLDLTVDDGIARLVLDRPEVANTVDLTMARELLDVAVALHRTGGVRVVLLSGRGRRFCAGGDLKSFAAQEDRLGDHLDELTTHLHAAIARLHALDAPLVAAVHGSAAGAGFSLACAADLLLAAASTRFVLAYAAVGLTPDGSGSYFLPRLVGLGRALDLALTNRELTAAEAEQWGLVTRVVADEDLASESEALAGRLAAGPTRSFGAAKRLLHRSWRSSLEEQLHEETRELGEAARHPDGREGVTAFVEKRPPRFEGR